MCSFTKMCKKINEAGLKIPNRSQLYFAYDILLEAATNEFEGRCEIYRYIYFEYKFLAIFNM